MTTSCGALSLSQQRQCGNNDGSSSFVCSSGASSALSDFYTCGSVFAGNSVKFCGIPEYEEFFVIGVKNLMNRLPLTASNLYAKNLFSFIRNLYNKEKKDFIINLEDEIISKTLIKEI